MVKVYDLVLADCRLKVQEIAEIVGISKKCLDYTMYEILGLRKLGAKVASLVHSERNLEITSQQYLTLLRRTSKYLMHRFLTTVDKTCTHCCTPETKEQWKKNRLRLLGFVSCHLHLEWQYSHGTLLSWFLSQFDSKFQKNASMTTIELGSNLVHQNPMLEKIPYQEIVAIKELPQPFTLQTFRNPIFQTT